MSVEPLPVPGDRVSEHGKPGLAGVFAGLRPHPFVVGFDAEVELPLHAVVIGLERRVLFRQCRESSPAILQALHPFFEPAPVFFPLEPKQSPRARDRRRPPGR